MSIEHVLQGLREWCEECGDVYVDESNVDVNDVTSTCAERGHSRALTDSDFEWHICDRCHGNGTLGGYPGWYTENDFAEDPDLFEDYMNHRRRCEADFSDDRGCDGTGKVLELTEAARSRPVVDEWIRGHYEMEAEYAAERRMGA